MKLVSFWSTGFYVHSVGRYGSEVGTSRYIAEQGLKEYQILYEGQLSLFDETAPPVDTSGLAPKSITKKARGNPVL